MYKGVRRITAAMKKEDYIKRYGQAAYDKRLQQRRDWGVIHREKLNTINRKWRTGHREEAKASSNEWRSLHREEHNALCKKWHEVNLEKAKASSKVYNQEVRCKGGKGYGHMLEYQRTGLQGERNKIRYMHWRKHRTIREATPNSVLHHEWLPGTANYRGVALVEKEAHRHGIIKVIKVLEGKITLFTEKKIAKKGGE